MVPTREQSQVTSLPELIRTDTYSPLALLRGVSWVWQCPVLFFPPALPMDHWKFSQKSSFKTDQNLWYVHLWLVFCFLPCSTSIHIPWAQQQTALNEPEIFFLTIFLLSNVWLYLFFICWLLDSLPAVFCQWKHPSQWMANSTMALTSGQISQSSAGRSSLENAQSQCISWVQRGLWLESTTVPGPCRGSLVPRTAGASTHHCGSCLNIHPVLALSY